MVVLGHSSGGISFLEFEQGLKTARYRFPRLLAVEGADVWSGPSVFSFLASARKYICSASASLPWSPYRFSRLLTVLRFDVWSPASSPPG
jgi:hypothetical protein